MESMWAPNLGYQGKYFKIPKNHKMQAAMPADWQYAWGISTLCYWNNILLVAPIEREKNENKNPFLLKPNSGLDKWHFWQIWLRLEGPKIPLKIHYFL